MRESKETRDARSLREMFEMIGDRFLDLPFTQGTAQEVEFLVDMLELNPRHRILDLACGPGRHSVGLGKLGMQVTGVDLSDRLLALAKQTAELEGVTTVEFVKGDAREIPYNEEFDAAICLCQGAFGLLESDNENERVLNAIFRALKPGGKMALTCLSLYNLLKKGGDLSEFDPQTNMYEREEMIQVEGGAEELFRFHERYYDFPGIKLLLERTGFRHILGFGCRAGEYSRRAITLDDIEILVYAEKPAR